MKNSKTPLQVGMSVRVYNDTGLFDGKIVEILYGSQPGIIVEHDDGCGNVYKRQVFPQQCRRLKPRAPKPVEREPIVRWMQRREINSPHFCTAYVHQERARNPDSTNPNLEVVRLVEAPTGVVVTREKLEKIWKREAFPAGALRPLMRALGLGEPQ